MDYEKFEMSLIIPFYYDKSCYEKMDDYIGSVLAEYMESYVPKINVLNEFAESLCTVNQNCLFKCMKLTSNARDYIGIHKNENCVYYIKKQSDICFSITKIFLWFHPDGNAFLTLQIEARSLTEAQILNLKKSLVNIRERNQYIEFITPEYMEKNNLEPQKMTLKSVMSEFLKLIKPFSPIEQKTTYHEAYVLSFGIISQTDESFLHYLEKFRRNQSAELQSTLTLPETFHFIPEQYPYLHWIMAEKLLSVTVDISLAEKMNKKNGKFLRGNFSNSIFNNYLMLYLYYIKLWNNYHMLEIQYAKAEQQLGLYPSKPQVFELIHSIKPLASHPHINQLFVEYLCGNTWSLIEYAKDLKQRFDDNIQASDKYDIFISYRRIYGGYIAQHIFTELRRRGYNPFFDLNSMRLGDFDEQIERRLSQSKVVIAVLTPGSLERCIADEEDWVYKELCYALEYNKKIITVRVDDFKCPEDLPEKLKKIDVKHGISMKIEYLNSCLETIIALIEGKNLIEE